MEANEAFQNAKQNKNRSIVKFYKEFDGVARLSHKPKFKLDQTTTFFTIGSCFARNIENHLNLRKIPYASNVPKVKGELFKIGGPDRTGYQNVYTPGSVLQVSKLALEQDRYHSIVESQGLYYDLLTHGLLGLSQEQAYSIRDGLIDTYCRLEGSNVLIITLGYNEAWFFKENQAWVNRSPAEPKLRPLADKFSFEILDFNRVYSLLEEAIENFKKINNDIKIILTVSPVPLNATFSCEHITVANQRSKSTLHCVAQKFSSEYDYIDYFPSYEIVTLSKRDLAFEDDAIHVKQSIVSQVMDCFFDSYF